MSNIEKHILFIAEALKDLGLKPTVKENQIFPYEGDIYYRALIWFNRSGGQTKLKVDVRGHRVLTYSHNGHSSFNYKGIANSILRALAKVKEEELLRETYHTKKLENEKKALELSARFSDVAKVSSSPNMGLFNVRLNCQNDDRLTEEQVVKFLTEHKAKYIEPLQRVHEEIKKIISDLEGSIDDSGLMDGQEALRSLNELDRKLRCGEI